MRKKQKKKNKQLISDIIVKDFQIIKELILVQATNFTKKMSEIIYYIFYLSFFVTFILFYFDCFNNFSTS